jgi:ribose transport system permease protein
MMTAPKIAPTKKWSIKKQIADHGMLLVLLVLCAAISALTVTDIHPEDPAAGRKLAKLALQKYGAKINVFIVVRNTDADRAFAQAINDELKVGGVNVVGIASGTPRSAILQLKQTLAAGENVDVIATHHFASLWAVFNASTLAKVSKEPIKVIRPPSYRWPSFLTKNNLLSILNQNAPIAIMAIGMTLVIITAGIDLSVGSLMALAAVVTAISLRDYLGGSEANGGSVALAFGIAMLVCAVVGAVAGLLITVFKIPPFVATLGLMMVARGACYILAGGADAVKIDAPAISSLYDASLLGVSGQIILMVVLFITAHVVMTHTPFGRYVYAVGGNVSAARLSGVPVMAVLITVYIVCGLCAGVAGVLDASHFLTGRPKAGEFYELQVIAAVVVGGTSLMGGEGKIFGTLIGALILGVIQNGLNMAGVDSYRQMVIYGALILVAVVVDQLKKKVINPGIVSQQ